MQKSQHTLSRKKIRLSIKQIEKVLSDDKINDIDNPLIIVANCIKERSSIQDLSAKAKGILNAYYQPRRIRDMLVRFEDFVNSIDSKMNIEIVRAKGYCNYIFYVENEVKKLTDTDYTDLTETEIFIEPVTCEEIIDFAEKECGNIQAVEKLISVKKAAEILYQKENYQLEKSDWSIYCEILGIAEKSEELFISAIPEIREIGISLENQTNAMKQNICRAREMYNLINLKLTKEWFDSINYELESSPINDMDTEEIKQYLSGKIDLIREIMEK